LPDDFPILSPDIEEVAAYHTYGRDVGSDSEAALFLCYPLVEFPMLAGLTAQELRINRKELITQLTPIGEQMIAFRKKGSEGELRMENKAGIDAFFKTRLQPELLKLQAHIDQGTYIQKAWKQFQNKPRFVLCMGVAGNEEIVELYRKLEVLQPYVSNTIQTNLEREGIAGQANCFLYLHAPYGSKRPLDKRSALS